MLSLTTLFRIWFFLLGFFLFLTATEAVAQVTYNGKPVVFRSMTEGAEDSAYVPYAFGNKYLYTDKDAGSSAPSADFYILNCNEKYEYDNILYIKCGNLKYRHYDTVTHLLTSINPNTNVITTEMDFSLPHGSTFISGTRTYSISHGSSVNFGVTRKNFITNSVQGAGGYQTHSEVRYARGLGDQYSEGFYQIGNVWGNYYSYLDQALINRGTHYEFLNEGSPQVVSVEFPATVFARTFTPNITINHSLSTSTYCGNAMGWKHFISAARIERFYAGIEDTLHYPDISIPLSCSSKTFSPLITLDTAKMKTRDFFFRVVTVDMSLIPFTVTAPDSGWYRVRYIPLVDIQCEAEKPDQFYLEQNYPNPFNSSTKITYIIPERGDVTLSIYNSIGELIQILAEGTHDPGRHSVTFDAAHLPAGVYFYEMKSGFKRDIRKAIFLK